MILAGAATAGANSPAQAAPAVHDVIAYVWADDWTSSQDVIMCQFLTTGNQRAWAFDLEADGTLSWFTSALGTSTVKSVSTVGIDTVIGNDRGIWVRLIWSYLTDQSNFYYSKQPPPPFTNPLSVTWTLLGAANQAHADDIPKQDSTGLIEVGSFNAGANGVWDGGIQYAAFYDYAPGLALAEFNALDCPQGATSFQRVVKHVTLTTDGRITCPHQTPPTNLDVIMCIKANDFTPAAIQAICGVYETTGNKHEWKIEINTDGTLKFSNYNGTGVTSSNSAAPSLTNVRHYWLRCIYLPGSSQVFWYKAVAPYNIDPDQVSFTLIGTAVSHAGGAINDSGDQVFEIGSVETGSAEYLEGAVKRVLVREFTGTTPIYDCNPDGWTTGLTFVSPGDGATYTLAGTAVVKGETWTIAGGNVVGLNTPVSW